MKNTQESLQRGEVKASYFWDDGSGINGDTGAPASGEPMQKGLFASPSWPLGTEGYVTYNGKKAEFFIGDRGPGVPSHDCNVLLDMDGKTFAELTGGTWNDTTLVVEDAGGLGHVNVEYTITKWGDGHGTPGAPHPFGQEGNKCESAVSAAPAAAEPEQPAADERSADEQASADEQQAAETEQADEQQADEQQAADSGQAEEQSEPEQEQQTAAADAQATPPADGGSPDEQEATEAPVTHAMSEVATPGGMSLVADSTPMVSGGVGVVLVSAVAAAAVVAKRKAATARPNGRHRKPALLARLTARDVSAGA
ncbi:hypothetical protein ACQEU5_01985 [Marinactinospora thermotolerans]|uniref:hypothetical protein n=1 Tax=Marinactinospora thermotolerans TaxID=531310 RepID=UPI003D92014D